MRAYLSEGFGAQAEYLAVPATSPIALKPREVSFEQAAAACDGALSTLPFLRKAGVGPGSEVLVYGASGAISSAAVRLARRPQPCAPGERLVQISRFLHPQTAHVLLGLQVRPIGDEHFAVGLRSFKPGPGELRCMSMITA